MGTQLVSYTKRSFRDASLRIAPWQPKSDGSARTLIKKGVLISSIRLTKVDKRGVQLGSDRIYAAIQQLGGVIRAKSPKKPLVFKIGGKTIYAQKVTIPASPFLPFLPDGSLAPKAVEPVKEIVLLAANKALGVS